MSHDKDYIQARRGQAADIGTSGPQAASESKPTQTQSWDDYPDAEYYKNDPEMQALDLVEMECENGDPPGLDPNFDVWASDAEESANSQAKTPTSGFVREEAERMFRLLGFGPGLTWEIRALDLDGCRSAQSGLFDDFETCLAECERLDGDMSLYVGLQPRSGLPVTNGIAPRETMPQDIHVKRISAWALDFDARENEKPAREEELDRVICRAAEAAAFLRNLGVPKPARVLTGNGIQMIVPLKVVSLDYPMATERIVAALRMAEGTIRERFESEHVRIDRLQNRARVVRLAGSLNRKGTPAPERPWRRARFIWCPEEREEVPFEVIESVAALCKKPPAPTKPATVNFPAKPCLERLPCCSAVSKLWIEGFRRDRSKALWGMALYLAFNEVPEEAAVEIIISFNARVVGKLRNRRRAVKYAAYWYARAASSNPLVPCAWLRKIGYCPGVAACDWGRCTLDLPKGVVVHRSAPRTGEEDEAMWKPKEIARKLEIKRGDRLSKIVDAFDSKSKRSGAGMTTVVFETEDRLRIYEHLVTDHPVAQARMLALLKAVGLADQENVETKELVGKWLIITVGVDDFGGTPQPKAEKFLPARAKEGN